MREYVINIMAQKTGKDPVRLGYYEVEATSEQVALEIATHVANKNLDDLSKALGRRIDETMRIWAEPAEDE